MSLLSRLRSQAWLRGCDEVGARPALLGQPWIVNGGRIVLGDDVFIASRPVQSHLVTRRGLLEIRSRVRIGHGAAISAHEHVHIGEGTVLGSFVGIADTDFHVAGDRDAKPETSPVIIGSGVRIGHRVLVLRGAQIGDGAEIAAGSVVSGSIPAHARVAGVPARTRQAAAAAAEGLARDRVPEVVQRVLGLSQRPVAEAGPDQLHEWDSLGSLKLLLALEEEFSVSLREEAVAHAHTVAALIAAVDAALSAAV